MYPPMFSKPVPLMCTVNWLSLASFFIFLINLQRDIGVIFIILDVLLSFYDSAILSIKRFIGMLIPNLHSQLS